MKVTSSRRQTQSQRVNELAASQFGLISRDQALDLGVSSAAIHRRLKSGVWIRELPTVYRLAGTPGSWEQRLLAALLWLGEDGVASYRSAGAIWKLDGVAPRSIELTSSRVLSSPKGIVVHFARSLPQADVAYVGPFRVTSPTRTLLDLASVVTEEELELALDDALRRSLTSVPRLRWALRISGRGRKGTGVLKKLVDERDPKTRGSESHIETRLLRIIRSAKLPLPVCQYEIRDKGKFIARADLVYPDQHLIVEADSYRFRTGQKWHRDRNRNNNLVRLGWSVLYITSKDILHRPEKAIEVIRATLKAKGHPAMQDDSD